MGLDASVLPIGLRLHIYVHLLEKKNYGMCSFSVWPQFFRVHAMVSDPPHLSPLQVGFPEEGHPNEHQTRPQVVHYTVAFLNDVLQLMIVHAH